MKCPKCGSQLRIIDTQRVTDTLTCRTYACTNISVCRFREASFDDLECDKAPLDRCLERIKELAGLCDGETVALRLEALADEIRGVN